MMEELTRISFMEAPSFGISGNAAAETAASDHITVDDLDFSFTSLGLTEATDDENFSDGRILPIYPVFNRNLVAQRDLQLGSASSYSSMSSEAEDLEDLRATASRCVPRPTPKSPERWRKRGRRWRLWDLILGRNRSDGMEKLVAYPEQEKNEMKKMRVFFPVVDQRSAAGEAGEIGKKGKEKGGAVKGIDIVTTYRIFYGKNHASARRSFLPYKQRSREPNKMTSAASTDSENLPFFTAEQCLSSGEAAGAVVGGGKVEHRNAHALGEQTIPQRREEGGR